MKTETTGVLETIAGVLSEHKAEDVVTLDVHKICDVADSIVIASGASARHVKSLTRYLTERLRDRHGIRAVIEGEVSGHWVVLDLGSVVIHIQRPEVRVYYDLEGLWRGGVC